MRVDGSCHCGAITYEADIDPQKVALCHCTDCQQLSGSAFTIFVPVAKEAFRLKSGKPKLYVKTGESGARRAQAFCAECGSRLYAAPDVADPPLFNLRVGTMRQRAELAPSAQLWCRSALGWALDMRSIRQIATQPK